MKQEKNTLDEVLDVVESFVENKNKRKRKFENID